MTNALGRSAGQWAAYEVDVTVGRQNGKGALLEARELSGIEIFGNRLIIHTAHELKTAEEARLRMEQLCEASQDLDRQVKRVVRTNGKEAIEFRNGARIKYAARSKGSGRGFAGADLVVMDEKMFLRSEAMAALLPTLSASPDPQVWYMGSAHFPDSDQQMALRQRMLAGDDPELAAFEWSVGEADDDVDLDDRDLWAIANPALGYRMSERFLARERGALEDADFAREHLGIGGGGKRSAVIPPGVWAGLKDSKPPRLRLPQFAVDVTPDRARASLAVAGARPDGKVHLELVANDRGTSWVVDLAVSEIGSSDATVVIDASSPAGSLIPEFSKAGIEPLIVSSREMGQACGGFLDDVTNSRLTHYGQPPLNVAVDAARKRPLGDAFAWHRKDPNIDISPLVAVTLARFGHLVQAAKAPKRTGKVW